MSMLNQTFDECANKSMKSVSDGSQSRKRGEDIGKRDHSGVKGTEVRMKRIWE